MRHYPALLLFLLLPFAAATAAESPAPAKHPPGAAIASAHSLATEAGLDTIRAGVAACGAVSRASRNTSLPLAASCSRKNPPPPRPELIGSTTPSTEDTVTAASKALPPARR